MPAGLFFMTALTGIPPFPGSKAYRYSARLALTTLLMLGLAACSDHARAPAPHAGAALQELNAGYAILRTILGDEQYLKVIRLTKGIVSFKSVSESTRQVIDDIAQTASAAHEELERLASLSPEIIFASGEGAVIEQITLRALRITTAKEFLASKENFEVILLVSQTQALRLVSHLAGELQDIETNPRRKAWLEELANRFEKLYARTLARLKVS
ncbi:MAG: hypothetical protein PVJ66_00165 [Gammaproteobacteria bacterium]|jgi:hypothetical protein